MSLIERGANNMISQFGETVTIYQQGESAPVDESNPVFFEDNDNFSETFEYDVRLYTTPNNKTLRDYGLEEDTDGMMWSSEDIAEEGDRVEYSDLYEWIVDEVTTSQVGNGPYIYVYGMMGI